MTMSATTEHPKVFISYSWTSVEHEQFVMELATSLRNHGVDAILDKWDLKPGQDKYVFMESMVVDTEVLKVLVLFHRKYQEKANIPCKLVLQAASRRNRCLEYPAQSSLSRRFCSLNCASPHSPPCQTSQGLLRRSSRSIRLIA